MKAYLLLVSLFLPLLSLPAAADTPASCPQVNCDCGAISDAHWRDVCEVRQAKVIEGCIENQGRPKNFCGLHGPAAYPVVTVLERMGKPPGVLSEQTRAMLAQYPWPGNVRELRNVVERVVNLGEEALPEMPTQIDLRVNQPRTTLEMELPFKEAKERLVEVFERDYLKSLLERCGGNISRAAREAGIARLYVRKLLKKHGLQDDDEP